MRFIALPVGQGDAFYTETDEGFRVLVDGGLSRRTLPLLFREYTKLRGVDVLVCTHNDADHAEGVIGFLESDLDCKELWLPATWIDALQSVPPDVSNTLRFLWHRFREIGNEPLRVEEGDLQEVAWRAVFPEPPEERLRGRLEEAPIRRDNAQDAGVNIALGNVLDVIDEYLEVLLYYTTWPWRPWRWFFADRMGLWWSTVLKDTRRLLEMARLAMDRGIQIRCFRHDPHRATVINGYPLVPLSSRLELSVIPAPQRTPHIFFFLTFLTTVNRESLVFYLESLEGSPGVLFTADSDLNGVNLSRVQPRSIVTAPHHGSHNNAGVYAKFPQPMVWVRSDGYFRSRPCKEYLSAQGQHFCTLCRNSNQPKQAVRLYTRGGRWIRYRTLPCSCQ